MRLYRNNYENSAWSAGFDMFNGVKTPEGCIVAAFSSIGSWNTFHLRADRAFFCLEPWVPAMKWRHHMEQRGWIGTCIHRIMLYEEGQIVFVAMEKPSARPNLRVPEPSRPHAGRNRPHR